VVLGDSLDAVMGKKKGARKDDDWEAESAAIAAEASVAHLDALFTEAIARGKTTDADYDRATDALASGKQTEEELIAFYFPNEALASESASKKGKNRGWRAERDGRVEKVAEGDEAGGEEAEDIAGAAEEEAALQALHVELFGAEPHALDVASLADGRSERERVYASELALDEWRRAAGDAPKELPLPNMSAACLFGEYGASTHAGGMVRLWDGASGRRLAASQFKLELTACTAAEALVAVGDTAGGVHLLSTESEFTPVRVPPAADAKEAVCSLALLPRHGGGAAERDGTASFLVIASTHSGALNVSSARVVGGSPTLSKATDLPRLSGLSALGAQGRPIHLASGPAPSGVFGAAGTALALHDLGGGSAAAVSWSADATVQDASDAPDVSDANHAIVDAMGAATLGSGGGGGGAEGSASSAAGAAPSRRVSYSPFWQLLATATAGRVVTLWDVRRSGDRGPVGAVRAASSVSWVHLDEALHGLSGHLLLVPSTAASPVQAYDVRRLASGAGGAPLPVATLPPPSGASTTCFAALGSAVVVGGGAKCGTALRYCGGRADLSKAGEDDEDEDDEGKKKEKKKKKRIAKKEQIGSRQSRYA
jgi:hypothetical protein